MNKSSIAHLSLTDGRGVLVLLDPNVSLAQCSLIISGLVEWLVVVVADVEVSGESGISGTDGGKSEEVADEGDIGGGDKCGGRVRSYDLRRRVFRSLTGRSLCGRSHRGRSLTGGSLTGCSLTGCSLTGCSLTGCSLTGCSLSGGSHTGLGVLAR
jgi:hypothetical protein